MRYPGKIAAEAAFKDDCGGIEVHSLNNKKDTSFDLRGDTFLLSVLLKI